MLKRTSMDPETKALLKGLGVLGGIVLFVCVVARVRTRK
jgi:hypothetical protein